MLKLRDFLRRVQCSIITPPGGTVAPLFALSLIPIVGLAGAAIDYSRANGVAAKLQAALDGAVIAGARDGSTNWTSTALASFNASTQGIGGSVGTPSFA